MRQRPRVGRRAQAGLNPTPWLHGPHGRSGWPPSPRVRCTPAPKKPSSHSLGESRPFPPSHTGPSDGRVYTVLPIRSSLQMISGCLHGGLSDPQIKDKGNTVWKAAGGGPRRGAGRPLWSAEPSNQVPSQSAVCCTPASPSLSPADLGPSCAGGSAEGAR